MVYIRKFFSLYPLWFGIVGAEIVASVLFCIAGGSGYIGCGSLFAWICLMALAAFTVWWWFGDYGLIETRALVRVFIVCMISAVWVLSHIPNPQYPTIVSKMYHNASIQVLNPDYQSYSQFLADNSNTYIISANGLSAPDTSYQTWQTENPLYVHKTVPYQQVINANVAWHKWFYHFALPEGIATGALLAYLWWFGRNKPRISRIMERLRVIFKFVSPLIPLCIFTVAYISWNTFATLALSNS